jgi:hypothetical protein
MEQFHPNWTPDLGEDFQRFERAAAKGHEESIWITSVLKDVAMESNAWQEAFVKTEEPLGWWFAGRLSYGEEQFDFKKRSAEGGCSWGQVGYGQYFKGGYWVKEDLKVHVEWLEKAVAQNNALAMRMLGDSFREEGDDKQKALLYYRDASELGWTSSMESLAEMLRDGEGCEKDLGQAVMWSAKGSQLCVFWLVLADTRRALEFEIAKDLDCGFINKLCYSLGWGLYWYRWKERGDEEKTFANRCLDYYCSCVEQQQKSIFTFLLCWKRTMGVKDVGAMIGKMVWEGREDNLVKSFGADLTDGEK